VLEIEKPGGEGGIRTLGTGVRGRALAAADSSAAEQALTSVLKIEQNTSLAAQADLFLASIHRKQGKSALASREMEDYRRIQGLRGQ
jgi:hypothetical protein